VKFAWIEAKKADHHVTVLCKALGVSTSGFYAWREREPSRRQRQDAQLSIEIAAIFQQQRGLYGSPRILEELREMGIRVGVKRVSRLMKASGLTARWSRKTWRARDGHHHLPVADNLLQRDFTADAPNQVWTADITYIWTIQGWLFLAVVIDLHSRRVVGWAADGHMRTGLVLEALHKALGHRRIEQGAVHHSDQGSQYAAREYQKALEAAGLVCSMSNKGDCWDNAPTESFFGTLKHELIHRYRWPSRAEAIWAIGDYIDGYYNPYRRHSTVGQISPVECERRYRQRAVSAA
jgi:putative transposase